MLCTGAVPRCFGSVKPRLPSKWTYIGTHAFVPTLSAWACMSIRAYCMLRMRMFSCRELSSERLLCHDRPREGLGRHDVCTVAVNRIICHVSSQCREMTVHVSVKCSCGVHASFGEAILRSALGGCATKKRMRRRPSHLQYSGIKARMAGPCGCRVRDLRGGQGSRGVPLLPCRDRRPG